MFQLELIKKNLDGIGTYGGSAPFDLIVKAVGNAGAQQIYCGSVASLSAGKTLAGQIFAASLTWHDTGTLASYTDAFTS